MQPKPADAPASHPSVLPSSPDAMAALHPGGAPSWYRKPPPRRRAPSLFSGAEEKAEKGQLDYPSISVIAVGTLAANGNMEYRVGTVTDVDFLEGLRMDDGSLNPRVAKRCFGKSPLYTERDAEAAARTLYEQTFDEAVGLSTDERIGRVRRVGQSGRNDADIIESQADIDASKQVCGIKIFHLNCRWPQ